MRLFGLTLSERTIGFYLNKKMLSNICSFQTGFNDQAGYFASRFVFEACHILFLTFLIEHRNINI